MGLGSRLAIEFINECLPCAELALGWRRDVRRVSVSV